LTRRFGNPYLREGIPTLGDPKKAVLTQGKEVLIPKTQGIKELSLPKFGLKCAKKSLP